MHNLLVPGNVTKAQELMKRAKAAGYNGIVLADYKLNLLDRVDASYFANLAKVRDTARELGLDVYASVCPMGYSNGLLAHDPNLAEGLPVKDAPFVAKAGRAEPDAASGPAVANGGFESVEGERMTGWDWQDDAGTVTASDTVIHHGGGRSLRMSNFKEASNGAGNARIVQSVEVRPWRQYHLSVWVKTDALEAPSAARVTVLSPGGRALTYQTWRIRDTQDWTLHHTVFNSLENGRVSIYLGVWGGSGGCIWWDDVRLEEAGLLNVLRRPGCPLTVKSADGTVYEEGRDFEPVSDPRMGSVPWPGEYEVWHEPPAIRLTPGTRIREGENLLVSYHHAITVHDGQVASCLSEPAVYELLKDQIKRVHEALHPKGYLLGHDELRVANWCDACKARGLTPGALLADNVRRCIAMVRAEDAEAEVCVWSDMFDPHHNAVASYYLVNGSLFGSWTGLDSKVIVLNWNEGKRRESVPWFAGRGHRQVIAGYYDGRPDGIRAWLADVGSVRGLEGAMYTTWESRYDDLEAFAQAAWGAGMPGTGAAPPPP
jgi:hypothetical protein